MNVEGCRNCGYSLIELIITIVISSVVISAIIMSFYPAAKGMGFTKTARDATILAEDVMNEILSKGFVDTNWPTLFGPEEGVSNRAKFNDVDDYNGMTSRPPRTIEGVVLTNFNSLSVSVAVENVSVSNFNAVVPQPAGSTGFKRIRVVVSGQGVGITNIAVVSEYD